jgi:hypothetical protein
MISGSRAVLSVLSLRPYGIDPRMFVGVLERQGQCEWRDPPTRYLITKRNAVLRKAVPIPEADPDTTPLGEPPPLASEEYLREWRDWHGYEDDYDPELDVEEESADMLDEALSEAFDAEGYETE